MHFIGGTPGVGHTEASYKGIKSKVYTIENFVHKTEIDHLNMFTLVDFVQKSKIAHKVLCIMLYTMYITFL